jgi:hypothetical protein
MEKQLPLNKKKFGEGGFLYEKILNNKLKEYDLQDINHKTGGSSSTSVDGILTLGGVDYHLEIKQSRRSMMGQIEIHYINDIWQVSEKSKLNYPCTAKHVMDNFIEKVNEKWKKPSGDYDIDLEMGNVYMKFDNVNPIKDHYFKDRNTPYIQIGKSGLYHMGEDKGFLGVPELNGTMQFRARTKYRKTNKITGKKIYGHLVLFELLDHDKSDIDLEHDMDILIR